MSVYPQARFLWSVNRLEQLPADNGAEVAFAGRSNAGKSSTINAITQRRNLARSGKTPGQTQLINFFELEPGRRLVDLPGFGYAKVPAAVQAHWHELVGGYLRTRVSLNGVFLIVDARRGLGNEDRDLLEWVGQRGLGAQLLLNKCDKLTRKEAQEILRTTRAALGGLACAQRFSAISKEGIDTARGALQQMLEKNAPVARGSEPPGQTNPEWG
jgi:GTP-binding protein